MQEQEGAPIRGVHRKPWHWISLALALFFIFLAFIVMLMRSYAQFVRTQSEGVSSGFFTEAKDLARERKQAAGPQRQVEQGDHAVTGASAENAQITIVQFADFECPYSASAFSVMQWIQKQYGDKVRIMYRHFPVATIHENASYAAAATECARAQGKFWELHDTLFLNQKSLKPDAIRGYASSLRLDMKAFDACLKDEAVQKHVVQDVKDGLAAGVAGTPTFFVNGFKMQGFIPPEGWVSIFNTLLR